LLNSIKNIIEAKAEILECLDENGMLIINGEDENCSKFPTHRYKGKILRFGFSDKFDIWASNIKYKDFKTYFVAKGKGINMNCVINTVGKYNVANALAAILVGFAMGLNEEEIINGLSNFQPLSGRLKVHKYIKDTILINDNFNANPDSTKSLLEDIPEFIGDRPLMLVMGDMERPDDEIKKYAKEVHFKIGEQIGAIKFEYLIAIGRWAKEYINGAKSKGVPKSKMIYFESVEEAEEHFKASIIPGSVIIFKASLYVPVRHLIKSLGVDYH
jgi:UDP-N-acetylmuramyl pentapeptide synthase